MLNGINYLNCNSSNHSTSFVSLFRKEPEKYHMNIQKGINTKEKVNIYNQTLRRKIIDEFEKNQSDIFIISGEDLTYFTYEEVRNLYNFLKNYFECIKVIAYVREPISFIDSETQQRILGGVTFKELENNPALPHYKFRFEKYFKYFGRNDVKLFLFDRNKLYKQNVVYDFLYNIGANRDVLENIKCKNTNSSFSKDTIYFIEKLNRLYPLYVDNKLNNLRGNLNRDLLREAERENECEKFTAPRTFNNSDLEYLNQDIDYVNQFLDIEEKVPNIKSIKNTIHETCRLNDEYLIKLINVLNLKVQERDEKVKQLKTRLREEQLKDNNS
ncbi:MAG: hypothetical protein FH753_03125 [Firmicutes bacterium]|nr:hypothetical protein [Bacillota bacterium]